jgi:transcriptional regulator with XRE-family HTH domain
MDLRSFGTHLRRRRKELGLTQRKLADKVGLSESEVSRIETAKVDDIEAETLYGLAKALKWDAFQMQEAYHGTWPGESKQAVPNSIKSALGELLKSLPRDLVDEFLP